MLIIIGLIIFIIGLIVAFKSYKTIGIIISITGALTCLYGLVTSFAGNPLLK